MAARENNTPSLLTQPESVICQYRSNQSERCYALALPDCLCDGCGHLCQSCLKKPCGMTGSFHILLDIHPDMAEVYSQPESDVRRWN